MKDYNKLFTDLQKEAMEEIENVIAHQEIEIAYKKGSGKTISFSDDYIDKLKMLHKYRKNLIIKLEDKYGTIPTDDIEDEDFENKFINLPEDGFNELLEKRKTELVRRKNIVDSATKEIMEQYKNKR